MSNIAPQPPPARGDENRQPIIIGFTIWTVGLSAIFVILRVVCRVGISKLSLWWDDWFIIVAILATVIGGSLDFVEVHFGFGRHQYYATPHQLEYYTAYTYGEWIQTFLTLMCTKVSICFFLIRIPVSKAYKIPLKLAIAFLILSNVVLTLLWIFQCWPIPSLWNASIKPDHCFSQTVIFRIILTQAIISVISDFTFAFYPILILWNVQMNLKNKIGLCFLMGLGVITGSCCIVRTVLNGQAISQDMTYGGITNWFWRLFEVQLGIICACIPTLIPGYKWVKRHVFKIEGPVSEKKSWHPEAPHLHYPERDNDVMYILQSGHNRNRPEHEFRVHTGSESDSSGERASDVTPVPDGILKTTKTKVDHAENSQPPMTSETSPSDITSFVSGSVGSSEMGRAENHVGRQVEAKDIV